MSFIYRYYRSHLDLREHTTTILCESELSGKEAESSTSVIDLGDLEALQGVVKYPVRIKCATLAWNTLTQSIDEIQGLDD